MDLLEKVRREDSIMNRIAIAGRLLSENKGIDAIIKFASERPRLHTIVLCGKDVRGHQAGQALLSLAKNGIDPSGRIAGAKGPYPVLHSNSDAIENFRKRVRLIDLIGTMDLRRILESVA
jgi:tetrahydromethanopterin S-methyltransferase subunit A